VTGKTEPIEGHAFYDLRGGLRPGESPAIYLERGPIRITHGGTKCAEEELRKMSEQKKIKVPDGMLTAAVDASMLRWEDANDGYRKSSMGVEAEEQLRRNLPAVLEAALLWQLENAPVPTDEQIKTMFCDANPRIVRGWIVEWIRRMYDISEPEVPQEIADLMLPLEDMKDLQPNANIFETFNRTVLEAYRRGRESTK
jgi:hypothetical protein